jgi:hypothetical protein
MLSVLPGEQLFPVPAAVEKATGRRPHPITCIRWRSKLGLPSTKLGGRVMTSVEAVHRWIEATNRSEGQS